MEHHGCVEVSAPLPLRAAAAVAVIVSLTLVCIIVVVAAAVIGTVILVCIIVVVAAAVIGTVILVCIIVVVADAADESGVRPVTSVYRIRLGTVAGKTVLPADLNGPVGVPASDQVGEPLGRVVVALLVAVDAWRRQREVQEVRGELRPGCRAGGA